MLILKGDLLKEIISPLEVIEAVENAMVLYEGDDFIMPARMHAEHEGNVLLLMPSFVKSAFGTKLITVFPGNLSRKQAVIQGVMLLNGPVTGAPIAMMDAAVLTGLRTGAVSAVGIRHLADPEVRTLGIIGAGTKAFYQAIMASQVRSFDRIYISDLDGNRAEKLATSLATELDAEMIIAANNEELAMASEVMITATTSVQPVLPPDIETLSGKTIVGIGSFKPTMREIPEEIFHLVDRVYVDSRQTTSFFKSVGMALFDLLVAEKIFGLAKSQGAGIEIEIS